jgi:hypothetical protein
MSNCLCVQWFLRFAMDRAIALFSPNFDWFNSSPLGVVASPPGRSPRERGRPALDHHQTSPLSRQRERGHPREPAAPNHPPANSPNPNHPAFGHPSKGGEFWTPSPPAPLPRAGEGSGLMVVEAGWLHPSPSEGNSKFSFISGGDGDHHDCWDIRSPIPLRGRGIYRAITLLRWRVRINKSLPSCYDCHSSDTDPERP